MATPRRNAMLHEEARKKIQTTQLINRLQNYALGKEINGKVVDLSPNQVTATLGLLKKAVPDLQSVAHAGDHDDNPIATKIITEIVDPKGD